MCFCVLISWSSLSSTQECCGQAVLLVLWCIQVSVFDYFCPVRFSATSIPPFICLCWSPVCVINLSGKGNFFRFFYQHFTDMSVFGGSNTCELWEVKHRHGYLMYCCGRECSCSGMMKLVSMVVFKAKIKWTEPSITCRCLDMHP